MAQLISNELSDDFYYTDENIIEAHILNKQNIYITNKYINSILSKYNTPYKIKNLDMFRRAMTHTSYLKIDLKNEKNAKKKYTFIKEKEIDPIDNKKDAIPLQSNSYERLEFLGDSVIRTILAEYLYKRYENEDEGFMTRLRTKIEKGESLAKLSLIVGLDKYILISKLIESKGGRNKNVSILEDVFEAFIGALFNETNFELCKTFFINLIEEEIDMAELLNNDDNYKDMLLQYYHKMKWNAPTYSMLSQNGTDNKKEFVMCVKDNTGNIIGIGSGSSKKKGQQVAAHQALIKLCILNEDSDTESDSNESCDYNIECNNEDESINIGSYSINNEYEYCGTESESE